MPKKPTADFAHVLDQTLRKQGVSCSWSSAIRLPEPPRGLFPAHVTGKGQSLNTRA